MKVIESRWIPITSLSSYKGRRCLVLMLFLFLFLLFDVASVHYRQSHDFSWTQCFCSSSFSDIPAENLWLFFCIIQFYYIFIIYNFACFEINRQCVLFFSFSTLIDVYVIFPCL